MNTRLMPLTGAGLVCIALLAGCGELKVKQFWPFGSDTPQERSRTPTNATEYQCNGGKRFFVRTLENGGAVWLILPEREVRLNKLGAGSDQRYSNGVAVLEIKGTEATLSDGASSAFAGCKSASGG